MHEPNAFASGSVALRLQELARDRARAGRPPPVLVIGGGDWIFGLGNIIAALGSAAVMAESIGAACAFSLGDQHYASALQKWLRRRDGQVVFPCVHVRASDLKWMREQTLVSVFSEERWRIGDARAANNHSSAPPLDPGSPFVLDMLFQYQESNCLTRADLGHLIAPPGMSPSQFWPRYRKAFEALVAVTMDAPRAAWEDGLAAAAGVQRAPGTGAVCGHMRLLHKENHRVMGLTSCSECGLVLGAMNALHEKRPFASYFYTAGANCSHCLQLRAPSLLKGAKRVGSDAHFSARIANGVQQFDEDDATGVLADMRALSRCSIVLVDDKLLGTFALTIAAAGRLTPCADPLAWLGSAQSGYGSSPKQIAGTVDWPQLSEHADGPAPLGLFVRALCKTRDMRASGLPIEPLSESVLAHLADDVRYDLSRPWQPRPLPRRYSQFVPRDDRAECDRHTKKRLASMEKQRRRRDRREAAVRTQKSNLLRVDHG